MQRRYKPKAKQRSRRNSSHAQRAEKQTLSRIEGMLDKMALSDDDVEAGDEEGGQMFATEIASHLAEGAFSYGDTTRNIARAFNPNVGLDL